MMMMENKGSQGAITNRTTQCEMDRRQCKEVHFIIIFCNSHIHSLYEKSMDRGDSRPFVVAIKGRDLRLAVMIMMMMLSLEPCSFHVWYLGTYLTY